MKLVIVESPAKAKTIAKYLGSDYRVDASAGHIRDLPAKDLGVDLRNNFEPTYIVNEDKKDIIKKLKKDTTEAEMVYLATDPDREGEAISWHLAETLKLKDNYCRITFNEISKKAVGEAINKPTKINMNLVNAQQARRVLDRLVGYQLSPILCNKIGGKLSAGRVQSAALKILVDREREIKSFVKEEYWTITAFLNRLQDKCKPFGAVFFEFKGKKVKIDSKERADKAMELMRQNDFIVTNVKRQQVSTHPAPPFTTSTLQQEGVKKLGLSSADVMKIAQQLYEGFDIEGQGHIALVTYIRTDSTRVSEEAIAKARETLRARFGDKYVPSKPNYYKSKKGSQDAHEAIRPINLDLTPDMVKDKLARNQYRLYKLIYDKFLASQAASAVYDSLNVVINSGDFAFKCGGKTQLFDGFLAVYNITDKEDKDEGEENQKLPNLAVGDKLVLKDLKGEQKFTKPPARYTEASLIKTLEDNGIGRPSTFATILSTLYKREYMAKDGKALVPTALGDTVTQYLEKYFADIVDSEFTAQMEGNLDKVEDDGIDWHKVVDDFYQPFKAKLSGAKGGEHFDSVDEPSDVVCEKCGSMMVYRRGRFGKYLTCPNCKTNKSLKAMEDKPTDIPCEKCGALMVERSGKFGKYLACPNYPKCKNTVPIIEKAGKCPKCGKDTVKRYSKNGKMFYGCTGYPECDYIRWDEPTGESCPVCGSPVIKKTLRGKEVIKCSKKGCKYTGE